MASSPSPNKIVIKVSKVDPENDDPPETSLYTFKPVMTETAPLPTQPRPPPFPPLLKKLWRETERNRHTWWHTPTPTWPHRVIALPQWEDPAPMPEAPEKKTLEELAGGLVRRPRSGSARATDIQQVIRNLAIAQEEAVEAGNENVPKDKGKGRKRSTSVEDGMERLKGMENGLERQLDGTAGMMERLRSAVRRNARVGGRSGSESAVEEEGGSADEGDAGGVSASLAEGDAGEGREWVLVSKLEKVVDSGDGKGS